MTTAAEQLIDQHPDLQAAVEHVLGEPVSDGWLNQVVAAIRELDTVVDAYHQYQRNHREPQDPAARSEWLAAAPKFSPEARRLGELGPGDRASLRLLATLSRSRAFPPGRRPLAASWRVSDIRGVPSDLVAAWVEIVLAEATDRSPDSAAGSKPTAYDAARALTVEEQLARRDSVGLPASNLDL